MKLLTTNSNGFSVYELTTEECEKMLTLVKKTIKQTYPDKEKGYAAVVMANNGKIFEGASYQSDSETLTMHGEAVALAHANLHGEHNIIAITGPNCHICKQLLWESSLRSKIDIVVIIEENEVIKQIPISTLMPYPWPER